MSKCDDSSSMGSDQVPFLLLRYGCQILAPAVMALIQVIQRSSYWPKEWKTSYITPLRKNGSTCDVKNQCPISLLPKISIVFEKMLFNFLYPLVRPLITNAQHGFIKRRSTTTQLISYFDVLYNNLDKNFPCASVYFDIRKAFDSRPYHRLLTKLAAFGFDEALLQLFFRLSQKSTPKCPYRILLISALRCNLWCPSRKCPWTTSVYLVHERSCWLCAKLPSLLVCRQPKAAMRWLFRRSAMSHQWYLWMVNQKSTGISSRKV